MKKAKLFLLFLSSIGFLSCTNDSESDLVDFDPNASVTYSSSVKNIIDNNCLFCHGTVPENGAPMSLTTYTLVKDAVLNRGLIDRISKPQGDPDMMPFGGTRLPQSAINQIIQWETNDFPQ